MGQFGDFYRGATVSLTANNASFSPLFNQSSSLSGAVSMGAASAEFEAIVNYVHYRIGEPILLVELDPLQIGANFEASMLRFNYLCNSYFLQSNIASILGLKVSYSEYDFQNALPKANAEFMNLFMANQQNQGLYNPNVEKRRGYIDYGMEEQRKDIYTYGYDQASGLPIDEYVASITGYGVHFTQIYHGPGTYMNRLYDPNSSNQFVQAEFGMPSYPPETVFYVQPLWQDILRGQLLSASDTARKSSYRHNIYGRILELIPRANEPTRIWFDFYVEKEAGKMESPLQQSSFSGLSYLAASAGNTVVTHFGNAPIKDLTYDKMNSVARTWIREYTLALSLQTLAFVRGKMPWTLPDGQTIVLNHGELMSESNNLRNTLETEIKERLTAMDAYEILRKEREKAQTLRETLVLNSPMPIFRTRG